jgi:hypothetical protein
MGLETTSGDCKTPGPKTWTTLQMVFPGWALILVGACGSDTPSVNTDGVDVTGAASPSRSDAEGGDGTASPAHDDEKPGCHPDSLDATVVDGLVGSYTYSDMTGAGPDLGINLPG